MLSSQWKDANDGSFFLTELAQRPFLCKNLKYPQWFGFAIIMI